jgi:pentatricopeptide repeat protein
MQVMRKFRIRIKKENYVKLLRGHAKNLNKKYLRKKGVDIQVLFNQFEIIKEKFTLNINIYNIIFKVLARRGLLGVMIEYYGEMLQNKIYPNVESSLYFTLAIAKRMDVENVIGTFIPLISYYPEPKSIIKIMNDMLLRRLSFKYLAEKRDVQRIRRNFGIQELIPSTLKDTIRKMELDDDEDWVGLIEPVTLRWIQDSSKLELFNDFDSKELRERAYAYFIIELCHRGAIKLVKEKFNDMVGDGLTPSVQIYTAIMSMLGYMNDLDAVDQFLDDMRQRNVNPNAATYHTFLSILSRKNADMSKITELRTQEFDQNDIIRALQADITKSKAEEQKLISLLTFETGLKPSTYVYHSLITSLLKPKRARFSSLRFDNLNFIYGRPKEEELEGYENLYSVSVIDGIQFELEDSFKPVRNFEEEDVTSPAVEIQHASVRDYNGSLPSDSTVWLADKVFDDMINAGIAPFESTVRALFFGHTSRNEMIDAVTAYLKMIDLKLIPSLGFRIEVYEILIHKGQYGLLAKVLRSSLTPDVEERDWLYIRYLILNVANSKKSSTLDSMIDQVENIHASLESIGQKIHPSVISDVLYMAGFVEESDVKFNDLWGWIVSNNLVDGDGFLYYIEKLLISGKTDDIMYTCTQTILKGDLKIDFPELDRVLYFLDHAGSGLLACAIRNFWKNHDYEVKYESQS